MKLLASLQHAIGSSAVSSEGRERYDSARRILGFYEGVREKGISEVGFMPYAYPVGGGPSIGSASSRNNGSGLGIAVPFVLEASMLLESVSFWNSDTTLARNADAAIYLDTLDNTASLPLYSSAFTAWSATAAAAGVRDIPVTSPPLYLAPGQYWVMVRNIHASNGLGVGETLAGTLATGSYIQATYGTSAWASTLDLTTGSPVKPSGYPHVILKGRVFGQSTAF